MTAAIANGEIRVVKSTKVGENKPSTSIVWQGTNITELSKAYPPSDILFADELGHSEIDGGHIRMDYSFEKFEDGQWIEIDDPRVRLDPTLTARERAIDKENRDAFPGDYGLADDEDDQYHCPNCQDQGCELCDPDFSEQKVEDSTPPNGWCIDCRSKPALEPNGLCTECQDYWKRYDEDNASEEDPEPEQVVCSICKKSPAGIFGYCDPCADDRERICPWCNRHHGDTPLGQGDPCRECDSLIFGRQSASNKWLHHLRRFMRFLTKRK